VRCYVVTVRTAVQTDTPRAERAAVHRALGDPQRLAMVELLALGDRTPGELATTLGLPSNLVAFHLGELEAVGIVGRRRSEGDGRRRYVHLRADVVTGVPLHPVGPADRGAGSAPRVLFVCTANQARSPLAAALWRAMTGSPAESAGTVPATTAHPLTRRVAAAHGLDVGDAGPRHLDDVAMTPDLVISVCDRAHEDGLPFDAPTLHWSVPDPVVGGRGRRDAFEAAVTDLEARVRRLAAMTARTSTSTTPPTDDHDRSTR
jgi:protein-tyrosine-phosphatase